MGRILGWTLGVGCALAFSVAPAAAQTHVSIGVFTPNVGVQVGVGRPVYAPPVYRPVYAPPMYRPVYAPPVYRVPVYREQVYYPDYEPVYYPPAYRERVVIVNGRHDNGRHNGWSKHGRGPVWRDARNGRDHWR